MSEENIIPIAPSGDQTDINQFIFDNSKEYKKPHYLLEYNGVPFSPLGDIQAMAGQKKNGKTFVFAQLMAAVLGSGSEHMKAELPGLKLNEETATYLGKPTTVLYIDTEMEQLSTAQVVRRVHWLCNWPLSENNPRFRVMWLRNVASNTERQRIVMSAIDQIKPTAVFIDGIRDIIQDFNDNAESSELVGTLMKKASENQCCIWNALHFNPRLGTDVDDGKMRGHLGTELGNKVSDTFMSIKKKTEKGVSFTVKQQDARGKDVEEWTFVVNDDAGELGIPCIKTNDDNSELSNSPEEVKKWITDGQNDIEWPATATEIRNLIKIRGNIKQNDKIQADLMVAKTYKYIIPQKSEEMAKGQKHPKYNLNRYEITPF